MLHLILGRSGSGKTYYARQILQKAIEAKEKSVYLIVPEQYSFESERAMLQLLGPKQAQKIQIVSFSSLTRLVFEKYGYPGQELDDIGREMLMSLAFREVENQLKLYKVPQNSKRFSDLVMLMLHVLTEMKMFSVSSKSLQEAGKNSADNILSDKIHDITLVLETYEAMVSRAYHDPLDNLDYLTELLQKNPEFFQNSIVVLDSFAIFTGQEKKVLSAIFSQAKDVYVTLCTDEYSSLLNLRENLFARTNSTLEQLKKMANEAQVHIASPIALEETFRFKKEALSELEKYIFSDSETKSIENSDGILIFNADNTYQEAEFVASKIRSLVMSGNYRYRDITIIMREDETYRGILNVALQRWKIPFFMDAPTPILSEPIIRFILCAFDVLIHHFESDDIFNLLKTGITEINSYDIALLENYTFVWNISGKGWLEEWTENPDGFQTDFSEEQKKSLLHLNECRQQIISPFMRFQKNIETEDGMSMAKAVYQLLTDFAIQKQLPCFCRTLRSHGQFQAADRQIRLWNLLMNILNQTAQVLKAEKITVSEYGELLRMLVSKQNMASIPQRADEVNVSVAGRMRLPETKVAFVMGACEGEFPKEPSQVGVFSEEERRILRNLQVNLGDTLEAKTENEHFFAYEALTSASELLIVSWPSSNLKESKTMSEIISDIMRIFSNISVQLCKYLPPEQEASAPEAAFSVLARNWQSKNSTFATLQQVFYEKVEFAGRLQKLSYAACPQTEHFADKTWAQKLFQFNRSVSATQLEVYSLCKFRYFCRYGLSLKETMPAAIDALEYGSLMHYLLEKIFVKTPAGKAIVAMEEYKRQEQIWKLIEKYAKEHLGGFSERSKRVKFQLRRMGLTAQTVVSHIAEELSQSKFKPIACELELLDDTPFKPMKLYTKDNQLITLGGKIDRVDIFDNGQGQCFVRVVDYKTGRKEFKLEDVLYGLNMQMLIYLAAVLESGLPNQKLIGAGILYMPVASPSVLMPRKASEKAVLKEKDKTLRMNGLILHDEEILKAMELDGQGKYIPISLKKDKYVGKYALPEQSLTMMLNYAKSLICKMAETLQSGDISAKPLLKGHNGCEWCPYFSVCEKEYSAIQAQEIRLETDKILEIMQEEQEEEARGNEVDE